jgi:hypothetical protein
MLKGVKRLDKIICKQPLKAGSSEAGSSEAGSSEAGSSEAGSSESEWAKLQVRKIFNIGIY